MADTRWWVFGLLTLLVLVGMTTAVPASVAGPGETVDDVRTVAETAGPVDQSDGSQSETLATAESSSTETEGESADTPELITADHPAATGTVEPTQSGPFFAVEILGTSETIVGQDLEVAVNVTNTGDQAGTQTVNLTVPGLGSDESIQALASGVSTETTLSVPTEAGDKGDYTATVQSEDDQDSTPVTVYGQPQFDVAVENVTTPAAGDPLAVTVNVTNNGEGPDTQTLNVSAPDLGFNNTTISLSINESTTETLSLPTTEEDVGNHTVNVTTADDNVTVNATVIQPPFFEVQIVDAPPVAEGKLFNVTINVTNTGDVGGTRTVDLEFAELGNDSQEFTLEVGESQTATLSASTEIGDNGTHGLGLFVRGDLRAAEQITILQRAIFEVTALDVPDVQGGDPIVATIGLKNVGEATATKAVDLAVDSLGSNSTTATLAENETVQVNLSVPTAAGDAGTYNVTASTEDDEMSGEVSVLVPAFFDVTVQEATAGVAGTPISVTVQVENTGETNDSQQVGVETALGTNGTSVSLEPGNATNRTLTIPTGAGDAGTYDVNVSSADDTDNASVTVLQQATFEVEILDTNEPVAGEEATVTAQITNVGDVEGTQSIAFDLSGLANETRNVTLGPDNATNETFTVQTGAGDAGTYTATVTSDDDQAEANLTVLEPPHFEVTILETEGTVAGGQANVTAEIANVGDVEGTQSIAFDLGGLASETRNVTLGPTNSTNETFTVQTGTGDAGTYTATVASDDDQAEANLTVLAPAFFDVTVQDVTGSVEGSPFSVTVGIENTGDVTDSQQIGVETALGTNGTTVSLDAGDSTTRTLTVPTSAGDAGTYEVNASSEDDSDNATVTVQAEAAIFAVTITDANAPVAGDAVTVTAEITNDGNVEGTQSIAFDLGGLASETRNVTLGPSNSTSETFTVQTVAGEAGTYTATVASDDDQDQTNVTVLAPAFFDVTVQTATAGVEGSPISVTVGVENTGDVNDSQQVSIETDLGSNETTVALDAGASTTRTLTLQTATGDAGTYEVNASSEDDSDNATVTVAQRATFTVEITDAVDPVVGDPVNLTANVTNVGDVEGTQSVEFDIDGLASETRNVTLGPGNSTSETVSVQTVAGDVGTYTATVSTADDQDQTNVTVFEPAAFDVTIESATTPVQGTPLAVTVAVNNTGGVTETQAVELSVGSLGANATNVTLAAGTNTTETLSVPTGPGDYGDFTASVTVDGSPAADQTVEVKLPPLAGTSSPQDLDDDGLYEDIRGDGSVGVFDVQTLFVNMGGVAAANAGAYNFQGSNANQVTVFDVQTLFGMT